MNFYDDVLCPFERAFNFYEFEMIYSMLSAIKFLSCIDIDVLLKIAIQIFFMCIIVGSRSKKHDRNGMKKISSRIDLKSAL